LQHRGKAAVLLEPFKILHAVAAGQVQEDHRQRHLDVQPPLGAGNPDRLADRCRQATAMQQVEIQRQTGQRGQTAG
jgi:hypothetical protein